MAQYCFRAHLTFKFYPTKIAHLAPSKTKLTKATLTPRKKCIEKYIEPTKRSIDALFLVPMHMHLFGINKIKKTTQLL
jgi:hypothetical protein